MRQDDSWLSPKTLLFIALLIGALCFVLYWHGAGGGVVDTSIVDANIRIGIETAERELAEVKTHRTDTERRVVIEREEVAYKVFNLGSDELLDTALSRAERYRIRLVASADYPSP